MNDDKIHTGICIVLPASHYGANDLSHCTLAFLGNTDEVDYTKYQAERLLAKVAKRWEEECPRPHHLTWIDRMDMFGVERDTPVGILRRTELIDEIRSYTTDLLDEYGMAYSKMFEYTPHVSIQDNPHGLTLQAGNAVRLYRPTLWWGNDRPQLLRPQMVPNDHR